MNIKHGAEDASEVAWKPHEMNKNEPPYSLKTHKNIVILV